MQADIESEYFDAKQDEEVDTSERHMQEVVAEVEHESDF